MATYKIFAEKDASIYSYYPTKNSGLDEILEVSLYQNRINQRGEVARALIKFPQQEIIDTITNLVAGRHYSASLKLYLANASSIPLDYTMISYPISGSWNMGTGRASNVPTSSDGVSWQYQTNNDVIIPWPIINYAASTTGGYDFNPGGGAWYNGESYRATQSFSYVTPKDLDMDVTHAVNNWYSGLIPNEGFVLKHTASIEFNSTQSFELKFFSSDSHTIYPPCLEIKWDDFVYVTGSGVALGTDKIVVSMKIKERFPQDSIQRIRINAREQFPVRVFQTSSLYLNNKYLPTASYYAIKDVDTEEFIIDFDDIFTKISADTISNYFDIYMNGLQPERWYKLLVKTVINGSTLVIDNDNIFKVTR